MSKHLTPIFMVFGALFFSGFVLMYYHNDMENYLKRDREKQGKEQDLKYKSLQLIGVIICYVALFSLNYFSAVEVLKYFNL